MQSMEFSFRHLKLTAEQKCDIAQRELEELRDEIEKLKDESEKILDNFRVGQQINVLLIILLGRSKLLKRKL